MTSPMQPSPSPCGSSAVAATPGGPSLGRLASRQGQGQALAPPG